MPDQNIFIENPNNGLYITLDEARSILQPIRSIEPMPTPNLPDAGMLMELVNEKIRDMERDIDRLKLSTDRLAAMNNKLEADTNRLKQWCSNHEECRHVFEDELPKLKIK